MAVRIGILGVGAVGAHVARQLLASDLTTEVILADPDRGRLGSVVQGLGPRAAGLTEGRLHDQGVDLVVVAAPSGHHIGPARQAMLAGVSVVSTSDRIEDVEGLLAMEQPARAAGTTVLVGVGFAPGLTCLLAAHGAVGFDVVDEVHVAKAGTGGPACARQHHRALKGAARDWRNGGWVRRAGGSGRELVWFPEPVSGADCYRAALPDAMVMRDRFQDAVRLTARVAATRQDRFTSWLPMLSPPHPEGGTGAIRVELRGRIGGRREIRVLGAVERPAIAAASVVSTAAVAVLTRTAGGPGVRGLASLPDPTLHLRQLALRGLHAQEFVGLADLPGG
jgi:saccharopine dehydrogenase-like NADP-dependent oxidoreductase